MKAYHLNTIDPNEPLDDLEGLRKIIGNSRIVALGESSHFVREFWQIRQRLLRFLHEQCGITIFAMEFGFAEGFKLEQDYVRLTSQKDFDRAIKQLDAAMHTVYMLQAINEMTSGTGLPLDMSMREYFMADAIVWHLKHSGPDAQIAILSHNNHIQRTPVAYGEYTAALPMGSYLHRYFGQDYCPIGITTTDDHTPEMELDDNSSVGFNVIDKKLDKPIEGSFEAMLIQNGYGDQLTLTDLNGGGNKEFDREINFIRSQSTYVTTSVQDAFSGLISVPKISLDNTIGF